MGGGTALGGVNSNEGRERCLVPLGNSGMTDGKDEQAWHKIPRSTPAPDTC